MMIPVLVTAAVSYLLGCCNTALIVSKYILHDDVRNHGSGNAGLTNFYRTFGKKMVIWVILGDLLKAILSCLLGGWLIGPALGGAAADIALGKLVGGVCAMLGHSFPVMFGFKGGKGVLCGAGVILCMDWRVSAVSGRVRRAGGPHPLGEPGQHGGRGPVPCHLLVCVAQCAGHGAGGGHGLSHRGAAQGECQAHRPRRRE